MILHFLVGRLSRRSAVESFFGLMALMRLVLCRKGIESCLMSLFHGTNLNDLIRGLIFDDCDMSAGLLELP